MNDKEWFYPYSTPSNHVKPYSTSSNREREVRQLRRRIAELEATIDRVRAAADDMEQDDMEAQWPADVPTGSQCATRIRQALEQK